MIDRLRLDSPRHPDPDLPERLPPFIRMPMTIAVPWDHRDGQPSRVTVDMIVFAEATHVSDVEATSADYPELLQQAGWRTWGFGYADVWIRVIGD